MERRDNDLAAAPRPKRARAALKQARTLAAAGERREAADILETLLADDPDWLDAVILLGRIRRRLGEQQAAAACARHALALAPDDDRVLLLAGRVALAEGDETRAEAFWGRISPGSREAISAALARAKHREVNAADPAVRLAGWADLAEASGDRAAAEVEGFGWPVARPLRKRPRLDAPLASADMGQGPDDPATALRLADDRLKALDLPALFSLQADLATRGSPLADYVEARLLYLHQCFEPAIEAADRFLSRLGTLPLPPDASAAARFTAETVRARSLGTIKRFDEIHFTPGLPGPRPDSDLRRALDLYWRSDPERGLALATALAFGDRPPVRATVLACYIPLLLGDLPRAERCLAALLERERFLERALQPELALCGARIAREAADYGRMARYLRYAYAAHDLEAPAIDPEQGLDFDTLRAETGTPPSANGPLVTVIVTAFNAERTLAYAIRSLTEQTHANLQIILVDDCSTDGTLGLAHALAAQDARIEVVASPVNVGTYACKNLALPRAHGRYYTVHDADDWSHPRRIERHVNLMESDPALVASASGWFRLDPSGRPLVRPTTGLFVHRNPASAFVRLDAARDAIGGYDEVRIDADNDHWNRLLVAFGPRGIARLAAPLAIGRSEAGSLTRSGIGAQDDELYSPIRSSYRLHGLVWRRQTMARQGAAGQAPGRVPPPPAMPDEAVSPPPDDRA